MDLYVAILMLISPAHTSHGMVFMTHAGSFVSEHILPLLTSAGRNSIAEYKAARVPGSRFFDIDGIADPNNELPHMLPSEEAFSAAMDSLGISNDSLVVVYDGMGIFSAPRAWWTFKVFGHEK